MVRVRSSAESGEKLERLNLLSLVGSSASGTNTLMKDFTGRVGPHFGWI